MSGLNAYLEEPWKYFFRYLLRIPEERAPHLLYGSAVDEALKWYARSRAEGALPESEELLRMFRSALSRQPLAEKDFRTYCARGEQALFGYFEKYAGDWVAESRSAVRLQVPFETEMEEMPSIILRGELDKVEYIADGIARIVDYKTGRPRTRGEIEGKTKTSTGALKRQLTFYRMLFERGSTGRVNAPEGMLDFVEPDAKGKYRRELFTISDAEVADLAETIRGALRNMYDFAFWGSSCDEKKWNAKGCALVEAIQNRRSLWD